MPVLMDDKEAVNLLDAFGDSKILYSNKMFRELADSSFTDVLERTLTEGRKGTYVATLVCAAMFYKLGFQMAKMGYTFPEELYALPEKAE